MPETPAGPESDAALVARCRRGDQAAWADLVDRFSRYVYAIAHQAYRLSTQDAEDVFQEVFARAFSHLQSLRSDEAIRPWIAQLTRRLCVDHLRRRAREPVGETDVAERAAAAVLDRIDEALTVRQALAGLSAHCQEILDRFFARDQSYRTIAAALDLPAGTIASRISRCLARLRAALGADRA